MDYRYDDQGRCIYTVGSGGYYPGNYPSRRFDGLNEIDGEWLYQKDHRLRQLRQHLFEYDDAGRMTAMQLWQEGHRPQLTKFRWNSQNQLTGLQTSGGQQWDYRYDAFGRRTEKICE
ncbi:RHS repeat domain-containing protein [Xenorhabdus bharatensis]|uniref:RHS repeat domain-containing protein n=1 Tax=Xenorhabdus bharatensis TaxID=3136256 RepID=UPI0030F4A950